MSNTSDDATRAWDADITAELIEEVKGWRHHIHAHPELGFEEHETAAFIRSLLDEWGIPYTVPLSTATVGRVVGEEPGPVLMIRADIDALPIQEQSSVSYASTRPGVMHACGHDGHTAILLGLAKILSQNRERVRGEIRLLFQPAEEPIPCGAVKVIEAGVLDDVMAIAGIHINNTLEYGVIGLTQGGAMAGEDRFEIKIVGAGGHAGSPHQTIDALTIAAGLVSQLQTLVSRRVSPLEAAVVSVGTFNAGEVYNAISGEARLAGTVRTLSPDTRELIERELINLSTTYAAAHNAKAEVTYVRNCPPLVNHADLVEFVRPAAEAAVGADRVRPFVTMGGEDFAFYGQHVPSVFAFIGAGTDSTFPHHHSQFDVNDDALAVGIRFFCNIVERWADFRSPVPETVVT